MGVLVAHHRTALEVLQQRGFALDARVGQFADLFTVEAFPALAVEFLVEFRDHRAVHKVDERVPYITFILDIFYMKIYR